MPKSVNLNILGSHTQVSERGPLWPSCFYFSSKPTTVCIFVFHIFSVRVFLIIDYLSTHAPLMDNTSAKKMVLLASESIIFAILLLLEILFTTN